MTAIVGLVFLLAGMGARAESETETEAESETESESESETETETESESESETETETGSETETESESESETEVETESESEVESESQTEIATRGMPAFTGMLATRKRQLVSSYYLYRGPAPSNAEMAAAIGAIDRLILQDYSLEDVWSTLFHILISEPDLAHKPFEEVVPPNIQYARVWRERAAPVKVVVEERYPEFSFLYKRAQSRKRALTWCGAVAFVPAYTLSIAFGTSTIGSLYDQAREQGRDFGTGSVFLPVIPLVGPILTQSWMDRQAAELDDPRYSAGSHLVGAVWGTLIQAVGLTAMIIGVSQRLPEPFEAQVSVGGGGSLRRPPATLSARVSPSSVGMEIRF